MSDGVTTPNPTQLRLDLLARGWIPVPITSPDYRHAKVKSPGKQPFLTGWQNFSQETLTAATITSWTKLHDQPGTGLVCGHLVVADIDVPVEELADQLKATAFALLGPTPFIRIGRAPKMALCYRVASPIEKMLTPELFLPDGTRLQLEILGKGQQVVAYGIHPNTRQPYRWVDAAPHTHPFAAVPETTQAALAAFAGAAASILRFAGGNPAKKPREGHREPEGQRKTKQQKIKKGAIATALDFPPPTHADVEDALSAIPNNHDWHGWLRIGAAIYDAIGDAGEELFVDWSAQSTKNDPVATKAKWDSFSTSPITDINAASLFWEARQNGWRPKHERAGIQIGSRRTEAPEETPQSPNSVELTEDGVARAFVQKHRHDLRYCHDAGAWYVWSGQRWCQNRDDLAFAWARDLVHALNRDETAKIKATTGRAAFAGAIERFARSDRAMAVTAEAWDRDLFLLGTPAGVIDLRSGRMRPAQREDMITRATATAPADSGVACPLWLAFLDQTTGGDADLIGFLQRWCGYCLTGDIREHALLFVFGPGGNGKSVFLNTVAHILGDYARVAPMETFTASQGDRHPTELAMLRGARLVTATETEEGRAWAEARIKQMTGGDPVSARFMRQDFFTYVPQFKLLIAGNHRPALRNVDEAARRRFNIVPFTRRPDHPDRQLEEKLREEAPAILRWMIDGCRAWQQDGLQRPSSVAAATDEYFEAQDAYGQWLRECCDLDPSGVHRERPGALRDSFSRWCDANGEGVPDSRRLRGLLERTPGVRYATTKGYPFVRGIRLLTTEERQERNQEAEREQEEAGGGEAW